MPNRYARLAVLVAALALVRLACPRALADSLAIVDQVSQTSYTQYLSAPNFLYTHYGDDRDISAGNDHDAARTSIYSAFSAFGLSTALDPFSYAGTTYHNVVATQLGVTRPNDIYVIGAHYDSYSSTGIAPGADDDASGVAGVLEAARVLSQYDFDATVVYIAFDREEQGLIGSSAYANAHASDHILGMVQLDMIAYNPSGASPNTVALYTGTANHGAAMKAGLGTALTTYGGLAWQDGGTIGASDHQPFDQRGFASCLMIEDDVWSNPNYHTPYDSVDTANYIDYLFATNVTRADVGYLADSAVHTPEASSIVVFLAGGPLAFLIFARRRKRGFLGHALVEWRGERS